MTVMRYCAVVVARVLSTGGAGPVADGGGRGQNRIREPGHSGGYGDGRQR